MSADAPSFVHAAGELLERRTIVQGFSPASHATTGSAQRESRRLRASSPGRHVNRRSMNRARVGMCPGKIPGAAHARRNNGADTTAVASAYRAARAVTPRASIGVRP